MDIGGLSVYVFVPQTYSSFDWDTLRCEQVFLVVLCGVPKWKNKVLIVEIN